MPIPFLSFLATGLKAHIPRKILGFVFDMLEKTTPTKEDADQIKAKMLRLAEENKLQELSEISKIVAHEVKSDHWLQRLWRPILMMSVTGIMVNTYIILPYINAFLSQKIIMTLPEAFYDLLVIGVGGYIVGRSVEKSVKNWRGDLY
jgi:hypothetical protein